MIKTKKQCKASWKASNSKDVSLKVDLNKRYQVLCTSNIYKKMDLHKRNQVSYSKCIHIYIVHKEQMIKV